MKLIRLVQDVFEEHHDNPKRSYFRFLFRRVRRIFSIIMIASLSLASLEASIVTKTVSYAVFKFTSAADFEEVTDAYDLLSIIYYLS